VSDTLDIVALGEPLLELSQLPGTTRFEQGYGGDTSNAAVAAARQGARVAYVTRVGADIFGEMFRRMWQQEGIDVCGVQSDPTAHTGVYFITHEGGEHTFSYLRAGSAASRMRPEDVPLDLVRRAAYLHVSGISQAISPNACDAVFRAVEVARQANVRVSYDPNLRLTLWPLARAGAVTLATAALADFFLPSIEDARALSGFDTPESIVRWAHELLEVPVIALKLGPKGVLVSDGHQRELVPGFKVASVDATGAGDCFDGAFLARLAAGDTIWDAARYANAAAALATTGYGAIDPLPRPEAVRTLLATMQD
jgi:2-dehydro-3-deoxygluconokinase